MEAYRQWLVKNRHLLSSIEVLANTIIWFLPDRLTDSQLEAEVVSSALGTVSLINQHILETAPGSSQGDGLIQENEANSLVSRAPPTHHPHPHSVSCLLISVIKEVESLAEAAAMHFGGQNTKWSIAAAIEGIKFLLRLAILQKSGFQMMQNGGLGNQILEDLPGSNAEETSFTPGSIGICPLKGLYNDLLAIGEMLFISRPLLYVLLLRNFGSKSWYPWLTSFAYEIAGICIVYKALQWKKTEISKYPSTEEFNSLDHLRNTEAIELKRRKLLFLMYLLRDPFFSTYTRKPLDKTEKLLKPVPFFGRLMGKAVELLVGVQARYFCTSAS